MRSAECIYFSLIKKVQDCGRVESSILTTISKTVSIKAELSPQIDGLGHCSFFCRTIGS